MLALLCGYDSALTSILSTGFKFGFPLHFRGDRISFFANNLISAQQNPEIVSAKISKELAAGRLAGPFDSPPLPNFRVSPLGVVPKKAPGEYRLIHHLSFPRGASVNDGISTEDTSVQYARVDDAVTMIKQLGQGCFLAKTDIKSAFRIIPILPRDHDLLGIFWQGKYYYDRVMPMGCASSCRTFEMFSTAIEWVAKKHLSMPHLIHILDDYLMAAPTFHQCRINLDRFLSLCAYLGVPMAPEKTVGPENVLAFAGIELDTLRMEARLPLEKTEKCKTLVSTFLRRKKVTLREIQSLVGLLNFACSVVVPGRAFLVRAISDTLEHLVTSLLYSVARNILLILDFIMESINLNIDNIVDEKNPFFGYVNLLERALELVKDYENATTTKFTVYTKTKNFGRAGEFTAAVLRANI